MWSPTLSESTGVLLISKASRLATIASSIILDLELDLASDDSLSQAGKFFICVKEPTIFKPPLINQMLISYKISDEVDNFIFR